MVKMSLSAVSDYQSYYYFKNLNLLFCYNSYPFYRITGSAVDMFRKVSYHKLVIADHSTYSHVTYARATPEKVG